MATTRADEELPHSQVHYQSLTSLAGNIKLFPVASTLEACTGISVHFKLNISKVILFRQRGFYGEGMAADSGLVMTVKTHGHTTDKGWS